MLFFTGIPSKFCRAWPAAIEKQSHKLKYLKKYINKKVFDDTDTLIRTRDVIFYLRATIQQLQFAAELPSRNWLLADKYADGGPRSREMLK